MSYKSENYQMIIRVTDIFLTQAFITMAQVKGLHISNDAETKNGIENIDLGNCISVGTSDKFQVNWAKNIDYYAGRGIVPVYDIQLDWVKIKDRLDQYIAEQNQPKTQPYTLECGCDVFVNKSKGSVEDSDGDEIIDFDTLTDMQTAFENSDFIVSSFIYCSTTFTKNDVDSLLEMLS